MASDRPSPPPMESDELLARLESLRSLGGAVARGELTSDQRRALDALQRGLEGLERRLLGDEGIHPGVSEVVDPSLVLDEALVELGARAALRCTELVVDQDPRLPARVKVDPLALREGLRELVGQALRRSPGGEVLLRATSRPGTQDTSRLTWSVLDDAAPLSPTEARRLARAGERRGLAWCVALAEEHQGRMEVEAQAEGNRVTWTLELPLVAPNCPRVPGVLAGLRVLVVDDNASMRAASLRMLEGLGCRPSTADSVPAAVATCAEALEGGDPFRVALVDIRMPGRGGFALPRELEQAGRPALVLVYANHRAGDLEEAARIGFRANLRKPLRPAELERTLLELLADGQGLHGRLRSA